VAAATFTSDFRAAEVANDEDGSFGPWTVGGYQTTDATPGTFTAYGQPLHLDNWGSLLPANGNDGPFFNGQFKGYGYDTAVAIPAIVVNTTGSNLSPCCGISQYAPGEVFIHSSNASIGDPDPLRQTQVIRYSSPGLGTLNVAALFTQKHSTAIPVNVLLNGVSVFSATTTGQNTTSLYNNPLLAVTPGSVLDFAIAGRASSAFDATITFTPVPEPSTLALFGLGAASLFAIGRKRALVKAR
jgi:hypothetical protein